MTAILVTGGAGTLGRVRAIINEHRARQADARTLSGPVARADAAPVKPC
jgi:hypothetical protein